MKIYSISIPHGKMTVIFRHYVYTQSKNLWFFDKVSVVQLSWTSNFVLLKFDHNLAVSWKFSFLILSLKIWVVGFILIIKLYFLHFSFTPFSKNSQIQISLPDSFLIFWKFHLLYLCYQNRLILFLSMVNGVICFCVCKDFKCGRAGYVYAMWGHFSVGGWYWIGFWNGLLMHVFFAWGIRGQVVWRVRFYWSRVFCIFLSTWGVGFWSFSEGWCDFMREGSHFPRP